MDQLVLQIKEAVASQGPDWLMRMAAEIGATPSGEAGAGEVQPAQMASSAPRGRPQRRRIPPTRLSPSPAVKKGAQNASPRPARSNVGGGARPQRSAAGGSMGATGRSAGRPEETPEGLTGTSAAASGADERRASRTERQGERAAASRASYGYSMRPRGVSRNWDRVRHAVASPERSQPGPSHPSFPSAGPEDELEDGEIQGTPPDSGCQRGMLPGDLMGDSRRELTTLIRNSVAESTWKRYNAIWKRWLMAAGGQFPEGARARAVTLDVIAELRRRGASASSARKHLSAIAFLLRLHGRRDVTKEFVFGQILKGWKKEGSSRDDRRPITFELLKAMLNVLGAVCKDESEVLLFRVAFSLAFFAALRLSEIVAPSCRKLGGLRFEDVLCGTDDIKICIKKSKTDVYGAGEWLRLTALGTAACPVALLRQFLSRHSGKGQLLAHASGAPLTKFQFGAVMRTCLKRLGFEPSEFGTHSFRIGAATSAFACGLRGDEVKRVGRWRSEAYKSYVRPNLRVL
ncbi:uncharacterized protein [Eleutherodactylus coqui]|uniref:uncharacterized protein n=1 Tax=Eleutherodactylus coqui TaxID=57060 RepID=UPI003461AE30